MSDSLWLHHGYSPWNSLGQNTEVGSLSLLQGSSNPGIKPRSPALQVHSLLIELSDRYKWLLLDKVLVILGGNGNLKAKQIYSFVSSLIHSQWRLSGFWKQIINLLDDTSKLVLCNRLHKRLILCNKYLFNQEYLEHFGNQA